MIQIDKTDNLYKFLKGLKVDDVDKEYLLLANNGCYKIQDIRKFYLSMFEQTKPENVEDLNLDLIVDYYKDVKNVKKLGQATLKKLLSEYKKSKDDNIKEKIISSKLKDLMFMCLEYKSLHKDVDIQDLIQVANIGLLTALEKYDETAKINFNDYLIYWVRNEITKEFEEKNND